MNPRALVLAVAASVTGFAAVATAEDQVALRIDTVLASNSNRRFDPRLDHMIRELKPLRFKGYRLLGHHTQGIDTGDECGIELPGQRYLHITTRENTAQHVKLNILINEGNRPIVNTDVLVDHGSVVLLGGPKDADGTLLIAIETAGPAQRDAAADRPAPTDAQVDAPARAAAQ